jgi:predicted transcriptional regulator
MKDLDIDPKTLRKAVGLDQAEFWPRVGVTQPGGSRYENGRQMPKSVRALLRLVYIEKLDLDRVKREDIELVEYLREERKDLYKTLRRQSQAWAMKQRR